jgi:hypothetical protein
VLAVRTREIALLRQSNRPVYCHPQEHLAVREVLFAATDFPDGHVRLVPDCADEIGQVADVEPLGVRDGFAVLVVQVDRVHQLAVDVELDVVSGGITNAYRPAVLVAREVVELELREVG